MAKRLQLRRGSTAEHSTFTGAVGEVTIDTDKDVVVVHDGVTVGGKPMAEEAGVAKADKILAGYSIANMLYTAGDLTKIRYNTNTDVDYELFTYGVDGLIGIEHYIATVLEGSSVLNYTDGALTSVIYTGSGA